MLRLTEDEGDAVVTPGRRHVASALTEHVRAQVDPDDPCVAAVGERQGDTGGAGGHIEDDGRVGRDGVVDHLPSPPPVLPE